MYLLKNKAKGGVGRNTQVYTLFVLKRIHLNSRGNSVILFCGLMLALATADLAEGPAVTASPLADSTQLIVVTTADWSTVDGVLRRYDRAEAGKPWRPVDDPIPVVVGKKGMGWGIGVSAVPTQGPDDPVKKEGDLKSPAGVFRLGTAFGFASKEPSEWKMPYLTLTPTIECVDDSHSKFYNRVVDRSTVTPDWSSSEHMLSVGEYYRWGVVIDHNPRSRPEAGSCVFLHIWGSDGGGTEGCTAMARPHIEAILAWLRPAAKPLLVQMPLSQYRQMEKVLNLPPE
ncbi:MAG: hypothetical protein WAM85_04085 [Terracidiphilus sp.]